MKLIAVTDDCQSVEVVTDTLLRIEQSVNEVILRERSKSDAQLEDLVERLLTADFPREKLIMHARLDLAAKMGISKVQLTSYGISLSEAKCRYPALSYGRSIHSIEEAEDAAREGADWLLYGHLFPTNSKKGLAPRGTAELFKMTAAIDIPIYAIGGIEPEHLRNLHENGVAGAAILSPIFKSRDAAASAKTYSECIQAFMNKGEMFIAKNY